MIKQDNKITIEYCTMLDYNLPSHWDERVDHLAYLPTPLTS